MFTTTSLWPFKQTSLILILVLGLSGAFAGCTESEAPVDNSDGVSRKIGNLRESGSKIVENPAPMLTSNPDTPLRNESPANPDASALPENSTGSSAGFPAVARALERGQLEEATTLLTQADLKRIDTRLLRARLFMRQGESIQALREIEQARNEGPNNGRVYGTAAELYIAMGRLSDAEEEIRRGLAVDGQCAAMERARGVYFLQLPGAAMTARIHLEKALELEPDLAFAARPLAAAHKLTGRGFLRAQKPLEAVRAARAGLELYPEDFELRQLHADALLAVGSFRHAASILEELLAEGHAVDDELALASWRAGMGDLIQGERERAVELFGRARELGMDAEALGSAAHILSQESLVQEGRGVEAFAAQRLEEARAFLSEALYYDPNNLSAGNRLAVVHSQLGMTELAIEGWTRVLSVFDETGATPPEPIHLNLARAFLDQGELNRAQVLLEHYEPAAYGQLPAQPSLAELTLAIDRLESSYRSASLQRAE